MEKKNVAVRVEVVWVWDEVWTTFGVRLYIYSLAQRKKLYETVVILVRQICAVHYGG